MTKTANDNTDFQVGDYIVYPAHGVGKITGIERETIVGFDVEVYIIMFEQEKMVLRVPTDKVQTGGMRPLADDKIVKTALKILGGKARIRRAMWSRRAQEYEAKINSGNMLSLAEVIRDLYRGDQQQEQSYSERQLYEAALDRFAREVAAIDQVDLDTALERLSHSFRKAA